jgi:hypothetical protein
MNKSTLLFPPSSLDVRPRPDAVIPDLVKNVCVVPPASTYVSVNTVVAWSTEKGSFIIPGVSAFPAASVLKEYGLRPSAGVRVIVVFAGPPVILVTKPPAGSTNLDVVSAVIVSARALEFVPKPTNPVLTKIRALLRPTLKLAMWFMRVPLS